MGGLLESGSIFTLKAWLLYGVEEPKDARTNEAFSGLELVRNWRGRSF